MVNNKEIKEAMEQLEKISSNPELRRIIELKQKYLHDEAQAKFFYEERGLMKGIRKGIKQGRELGIQEGIIEGRKTGIEEGRIEGQKKGKVEGKIEGKVEGKIEGKIEVVKKMLENNFDLETISTITELSTEKIKEIQNSL